MFLLRLTTSLKEIPLTASGSVLGLLFASRRASRGFNLCYAGVIRCCGGTMEDRLWKLQSDLNTLNTKLIVVANKIDVVEKIVDTESIRNIQSE